MAENCYIVGIWQKNCYIVEIWLKNFHFTLQECGGKLLYGLKLAKNGYLLKICAEKMLCYRNLAEK